MTRLLAALFILAGISMPALAQYTAPPDDTEAAASGTDEAVETAEQEEEGEDDDDDAAGAGEGVFEAQGMFDYGFSGIMARDNRTDLAPLMLGAGKPVAGGEYTLKSGGFYRITIEADGTQELALSGGDFFRAIWINEVIVNDIEIRPMGVHSIEFDAAGEAEMSFVAIVPGRYTLAVPGSSGETLQAVFNIQ